MCRETSSQPSPKSKLKLTSGDVVQWSNAYMHIYHEPSWISSPALKEEVERQEGEIK